MCSASSSGPPPSGSPGAETADVPRQFANRREPDALRAQISAPTASAPPPTDAPAPMPDEEQVVAWLRNLQLLTGVPFNYLVPDAAMLPAESIRFFQVDTGWVDCLLDGAYSLGGNAIAGPQAAVDQPGVLDAARARAAQVRPELIGAPAELAPPAKVMSGFLLRSSLVSGWPGLEILGYADAAGAEPLTILRLERVSATLLLCLFDGLVSRLDLQEPGEGIHFGVEDDGTKELRYADGDDKHPIGSFTGVDVPVPKRGSAETRVVRLADLATTMPPHVWAGAARAFTAAEFALEMVEGVDAASFRLGSG